VYWYTPVIPALGRWRQKDHYFKASLVCIAKLYLKKKKNYIYNKFQMACIYPFHHFIKLPSSTTVTKSIKI
jgi:hypothetical protein